MAVASVEELSDDSSDLIYDYRVKNTRLKPKNKKKKVIMIHSCIFKFTCNLDSWLHTVFIRLTDLGAYKIFGP